MSHLEARTLQANDAIQGDYSGMGANVVLQGIGVSFYVAAQANVEIVTRAGTTILYTDVPAGSQIMAPLFAEIGTNTTSADMVVAIHKHPLV